MQYRLRTLLIVLALGPMVLAGQWFSAKHPDPGFINSSTTTASDEELREAWRLLTNSVSPPLPSK